MSDANRVSIRYVEESTGGTTPASPTLEEIKLTGTSDMGFTPETVVSEIIRSDRQENDLILINGTVGGQFDTELISAVHDDLIEGVLWADSTWTTETVKQASFNGTVTLDTPTGQTTIVDSDTNGTIGAGGIAAGDWIEVSDGTNTNYMRVASVTNGDTLVVEGINHTVATGTLTVVQGSEITNGSTQKYFTFEKAYLDHSPVTYEYLRGMVPGTMSLTTSSSAIVTGSFGFTGFSHQATTTRVAGASDQAAPAGVTYNASSNVATIAEGGSNGLNIATEISIEIDNNLRELNAIGTLGAAEIGAGTFSVSGSIQTYFEDATMLDKLINNTETSLSFAFTDGAGTTMIFDLPSIKFSEGVPEVPGKNEDVMLNLGFQAFANSTLGYTMKVTRFGTAV